VVDRDAPAGFDKNVAGDHARSASDLGLGFVGISIFYREGYFQQAINQDDWQADRF
jgi:starch phosphorylase